MQSFIPILGYGYEPDKESKYFRVSSAHIFIMFYHQKRKETGMPKPKVNNNQKETQSTKEEYQNPIYVFIKKAFI